MATGRNMQLTKQVGEYLVAAEVCRLGYIATTFTGNVPHYDIIASNASGGHQAIQVKAILQHAWQFDIRDFVDAVAGANPAFELVPAEVIAKARQRMAAAASPELVRVQTLLGAYEAVLAVASEELRSVMTRFGIEFPTPTK